jgi:hypothetical protein
MKHKKTTLLSAISVLAVSVFAMIVHQSYHPVKAQQVMPRPGGYSEEELEERREAFFELSHRAAPGVDWRAIERQNASNTAMRMQYFAHQKTSGTTTSFAGGYINGTWYERGNKSLAGRANKSAYFAPTNTLYQTTDGGCIYRTTLPTPDWKVVCDKVHFDPGVIEVCARSGGTNLYRLFATSNQKLLYSDNNGVSFDTATGINYPVAWSGNYIYKIFSANDQKYVYAAVDCWDNVQSREMAYLYVSTTNGASFSLLRKFPAFKATSLSLSRAYNDVNIYMLGISGVARDTLFQVIGSRIIALSNTATFPSSHNQVKLMTQKSGTTVHFYAYTGGTNLYHSSNSGITWNLKKTFGSANYGLQLGMAINNVNKVYYGDIEAYRSSDSGATFTKINNWGDYYGDPAHKLHADIQDIYYSKYSSGTEFGIITCDGGAYLTTDEGVTVYNLSLLNHNIVELWDHKTHPTNNNVIFGGSQDQGMQSTISGGGTGIYTSKQFISGDYGQLRITGSAHTLWAEYPGGNMYLWQNITDSIPTYINHWQLTGTQKPNSAWMPPTSDYFSGASGEKILIGGGEVSGGSGSYLIKLSLSGSTITPSQYSYNFRANSNSGSSGISSIAVSKLSNSYIYVAAEDGTFFYSTDSGTNWTKTASFPGVGGNYLYGSSIVACADNVEKVYFGGSGYSNPAVYMSRNHGQSFSAMSTGLPSTTVNRLAAYKNDSFLFAATDAGPYAYVKATNQWYSLMDPSVPVVVFRSVEYVSSINTVRFGTYARGMWDLVIGGAPGQEILSIANGGAPKAEIKLYPNPVVSGQFLNIEYDGHKTMVVEIFDFTGKRVMNSFTTNGSVNTSSLPAGAYFCRISIEGIKPYVTKFLVQ